MAQSPFFSSSTAGISSAWMSPMRFCTRPALKPASRMTRTAWSGPSVPSIGVLAISDSAERSRPWCLHSHTTACTNASLACSEASAGGAMKGSWRADMGDGAQGARVSVRL
jgi:hypothetical protein